MFKKIFLLLFIIIFTILGTNAFYFLSYKAEAKVVEKNFVSGDFLIKLKNIERLYKIENSNFSINDWENLKKEMPEIELVEPNYLFQMSYVPNDPYYHEQWYLDKIKAPQGWDLVKGGSEDIVIAILDTGVDISHPDLKENIYNNLGEIAGDGIDNDQNGYIDDINGWDFVRNVPNPKPKFDEPYTEGGVHHGTLVAGIAAGVGDNVEGITGLAWKSKIMPLRVLNSEGNGSVEDVIRAVNYAIDNGAKIINLSFVGTSKSYFLSQALKKAWDKGIIIVAAAGNETLNAPANLNENPNYPICLDEDEENFILGVAAVDNFDKKALFSDYGSNCVDISAPGTKFYGPLVYNPNYEGFKDYYGGYWSGTSISAPLVSGLAALVWAVNPLFSHKQVQDFIMMMADNIDAFNPDFSGQLGQGRVNVYQTISYARSQIGATNQSYYIITGAGAGGGPHVRVFDSVGLPVSNFFAYNESFKGGVQVAAGDVDGDGKDEIITGAGAGGGPHVRVFDLSGWPKGGFFAFNEDFKGGVQVAAGDVDGDGKDEIITGAGAGGGPHIRVFDQQGNLKLHFFAYNESFKGGVQVAAGDVDGDGKDEIIAAVGSGASSYIRVFNSEFILLRLQFLAYKKEFYYGAKVAVADFNHDGKVEIITSPIKDFEPEIKVFSFNGDEISKFYAYSRNFKGGAQVATMRSEGY